MKATINLDPIKGHIVLYCKGWYKFDDFFEGLKRIWAVRCGYDYELTDRRTLEYIADEMFEIIWEVYPPEKVRNIMRNVHKGIIPIWKVDEKYTPIEALIYQYGSCLSNLQIRETDRESGKTHTLVKLPRPKTRVFNRILKGQGEYKDYELINK
jgi:hypothetical protein